MLKWIYDRSGVLLMNGLGERIKKLRIEKKLTLAQLAGERLTKGMLSLIENGKAKPSMESLHYIAEQLGVDIVELLNEGNVKQFRKLLLEIEQAYKETASTFTKDELVQLNKLFQQLDDIREQLQGNTYEEVRLLDLHTRLNHQLHNVQDLSVMYDVITAYEKIHVYRRIISCYSFLCGMAFERNDYMIALHFMQEAEQRVQSYIHLIDPLSTLDMHYQLSVLYAAVDDSENTQHHLEHALEIAHKEKIYYRIDDFYRFILLQAISQGEQEKSKYYLTKLKQHADFTEDPVVKQYLTFCKAHYINFIDKEYERIPRLAKEINHDLTQEHALFVAKLFCIEETYAFWARGYYKEAIECSKEMNIPPNVYHPMELSLFYQCFAVRALCFVEEGDKEAAKRDIVQAYDGVKNFPNTIYKTYIHNAYGKILYGSK